MSRGVIEQVQLVGSVVFALPVAFFGALKLAGGDTLLGAGFLALAVVMFVGQEVYTSPTDLAAGVAQRVTGRVVDDPDEE